MNFFWLDLHNEVWKSTVLKTKPRSVEVMELQRESSASHPVPLDNG